jgi:hypothetical protein
MAQCARGAQGAHGPPQSMSVSVPFRMPSLHPGVRQTWLLQTPEAQSPLIVQ